ncbi:DotH/IcmK family type IV secretion protein [Amorphus sp. 3PC139-8]|uniref:DotH/IcmK family type IV secretion protein n=1 Tax=Amorphus sp. 3PC139-8 TaxID=2735676 RepID=UPI00345D9A3D
MKISHLPAIVLLAALQPIGVPTAQAQSPDLSSLSAPPPSSSTNAIPRPRGAEASGSAQAELGGGASAPLSAGESDGSGQTIAAPTPPGALRPLPRGASIPSLSEISGSGRSTALSSGHEMSPERADGFNEAVQQLFPMTPEMIRKLKEIYDESQEAIQERPLPNAVVDADLVSLEPGAPPPTLNVVPGIASVISVFDATGRQWPIRQYVVGNGRDFQVLQLGEKSNSLTVTPLSRVGWTNLVVALEGEPTPISMTVSITRDRAHYRHDIQVMAMGPNAEPTPTSVASAGPRPGDSTLLAAVAGVDMPQGARAVDISGIQATGWLYDGDLFLRSRHALLSPRWTGSLSGPDGVRVYRLAPARVVLFSENGRPTRARVELP